MAWYTYMLRCSDGSLYTGITTDLVRRLAQHRAGKTRGGAKYTSARHALGFECAFECPGRPEASRLEAQLKKLTRSQKLAHIAGTHSPDSEGCIRINIDAEGHII